MGHREVMERLAFAAIGGEARAIKQEMPGSTCLAIFALNEYTAEVLINILEAIQDGSFDLSQYAPDDE